MRPLHLFLTACLFSASAWANDPPAKPGKASAPKEEIIKDEKKLSSKDSKESKSSKESEAAAKAKETQATEELAVRIAERLSALRAKDDALRAASVRSAPNVRSPYAPAPRRANSSAQAETAKNKEATPVSIMHHDPNHWTYQGESGPLNWGKLNPANAKCDTGQRQSPIDIRDGIRVDLEPIMFDYKSSRFAVIDNGHTIQVNMGAGNYISVMGQNYELVQFHFHKPSEERVNGKNYEMVVHLVHKDPEGKLAVVAVLIERGKAQNIVQQVWNNLPLEKNEAVNALSMLDLSQLLPVKRDYYTYMGSLTTPPCSEGVLWLVMKEPIEVSPEQLNIFTRLYPMNARPIQRTSGRLIKESN